MPDVAQPPNPNWQFHANNVVTWAEEILWSPQGQKARDYLQCQRGLTRDTIINARLGYIPAQSEADYKYGRVSDPEWVLDEKPVRVHCGITIPHFADGQLWAVRIRRAPGVAGPKYMGIRGGSKCLYRVDEIYPKTPVLIVEGEFDALVADFCAGWIRHEGFISAIALASASNKHIPARWLDKLVSAPVILTRMDSDPAGESANTILRQLSSRSRPIQVPQPYKDVNEFYLACGPEGVREWLRSSYS
jgi:DNA primase